MLESRLFVALMPDSAARDALQVAAREVFIRANPVGRRTAPENLHLTLQFLGGKISADQTAAIRQALSLVRADPFEITIDHAKSFGAAGVWWIGPRLWPAQLDSPRQEIVRRTASVGVTSAGKFVPHVTIVKSDAALAPTPVKPVRWPVSSFALVRSDLSAEGAKYSTLEQWPLQGGSARSAAEQMSLL